MSNTTELKEILTELHLASQNAVEEFKQSHTPEKIQEQVFNSLNQARDTIMRSLLGFDKGFGNRGWKIDHCSGRAGYSAAGDYIQQHQEAAVFDWLKQVNLKDVGITKSMEKSLLVSYENLYMGKFKELIKARAEQDAMDAFNALDTHKFLNDIKKLEDLIESV